VDLRPPAPSWRSPGVVNHCLPNTLTLAVNSTIFTFTKDLSSTLQVGFQNISVFLQDDEMDYKFEVLQCFITDQQIWCLQFHWIEYQLGSFTWHRTTGQEIARLAGNITVEPGIKLHWNEGAQWNSLSTWQHGNSMHESTSSPNLKPSDDLTGLGRWCWTRV